MATFKVGQRVKYINTLLNPQVPTGTQGVVVELGPYEHRVVFDGCPATSGAWGVFHTSIVPLTDPRADEFIADMERFSVVSKPKEIA